MKKKMVSITVSAIPTNVVATEFMAEFKMPLVDLFT